MQRLSVVSLIACLFLLLSLSITLTVLQKKTTYQQHAAGTQITFSGLKVSGNKLVNQQGQQVILHGVDRSGAEYECVTGSSVFDGPSDSASIQAMRTWDIDIVRVPLNEDCWLGINGVKTGGTTYQQAIKNYVSVLNQNGMYVILDLHWNAPGTTKATGQTDMADSDHSPAFWSSVASAFKGNNTVIFDLYNEPHDISWSCWKDSSSGNCGTVAGMNQLIAAVRGTGATNVVMAGGLGWASDLSEWIANKPTDPLNNIAASWHMYGNSGCESSGICWNTTTMANVISQVPVIVGEFGESSGGSVCGTNIINTFMNWLDQHQTSYVAWTWDTWGGGCGALPVITDYTGTAKSPNGVAIKAHYLALGSTTVIGPSTPTATPTPASKATPTSAPKSTPPPTSKITPTPTIIKINPTPTIATAPPANSSPVPTDTSTSIDVTVFEHGIGDSGDSVNPSGFSFSNQNPTIQQIPVDIQVFTSSNQLIASGSSMLNYDSSVGAFTATNIPISSGFPTGEYTVWFKTDYHLSAVTSALQTIASGQENVISPVTLIAGDVLNDDTLSILDYNVLIGCYSDLSPAVACTSSQQVASDLNDDGSVNQDDYNLFLREISVQQNSQ